VRLQAASARKHRPAPVKDNGVESAIAVEAENSDVQGLYPRPELVSHAALDAQPSVCGSTRLTLKLRPSAFQTAARIVTIARSGEIARPCGFILRDARHFQMDGGQLGGIPLNWSTTIRLVVVVVLTLQHQRGGEQARQGRQNTALSASCAAMERRVGCANRLRGASAIQRPFQSTLIALAATLLVAACPSYIQQQRAIVEGSRKARVEDDRLRLMIYTSDIAEPYDKLGELSYTDPLNGETDRNRSHQLEAARDGDRAMGPAGRRDHPRHYQGRWHRHDDDLG
jgi:hypothetical protein